MDFIILVSGNLSAPITGVLSPKQTFETLHRATLAFNLHRSTALPLARAPGTWTICSQLRPCTMASHSAPEELHGKKFSVVVKNEDMHYYC
jgi:hypothetical protein